MSSDTTEQPPAETPPLPPTPENRRAARVAYRRPMVALKAAHFADRTFMQRFADSLIRIGSDCRR
jgi:hypothetical protein